jgi:replicative DNA helicase
VGEQTASLKALAIELDVPVLVLCQLSRAAVHESRPALHHLRESGSIEQDADVVLLLHRPEGGIVDKETQIKLSDGDLNVAKNRNGDVGSVRLDWDGARTRYCVVED